jgi:multiple sugar transport system substrate-binding protein
VIAPGTRRAVLGRAAAGAAGLTLAACGTDARGGADSARPVAGPKEITWSSYQLGDHDQKLWEDTFKIAGQVTGVKTVVVWEPGDGYWDKRQTEFAAGSANLDVMINSQSWVLPGGLNGMFPDHNEYLRRDKVDTKQYYQADLLSWSWKGKQWALPMQSGGEVVLYNKALFDAKGVKYPAKDWTYDDLIQSCQRLNDPANNKFALLVGQNGLQYMAGTFLLNFGGKILNPEKNKALYGDDPKSIQGASMDVDLHQKYRFVPTAEANATLPKGVRGFEAQMVAIEINGVFRHSSIRAALGEGKLDFAPPPKGPAAQTASVAGDGWSLLKLSNAQDAAWRVLKYVQSKEGLMGPVLPALSWPPLLSVAGAQAWLDLFKGTKIAEATRVWETAGHELITTPEGRDANMTMNAAFNKALAGEMNTPDAMRESARALNELFSRRPAAWQ